VLLWILGLAALLLAAYLLVRAARRGRPASLAWGLLLLAASIGLLTGALLSAID
jgi:hypothetical protein